MKVRKKIQNSPFKHKLQGFLEEWSHSSAPGRTAHVISQEEMGLKQQKIKYLLAGWAGSVQSLLEWGERGDQREFVGEEAK